jgi:RimJ/RimL family protein N-acetyltransferase
VYDFNPRARRLYERVGFVLEGTLRHAVFREGRFADVHRMAILAGEWRAGPDAASAAATGPVPDGARTA